MTLNEIKLLASADNIKTVTVIPAPTAPQKWCVLFERQSGETIPLIARRKNIRYFATVDAAIDVIKTIGIEKIAVDWSQASAS